MHIRAEANLKVLYRGINKVCAWNARGNLVIVIIFYLRFISDHIFIHLIFIAAVHHRSNKKRVNKVVFLHYPDFLHCSLCI